MPRLVSRFLLLCAMLMVTVITGGCSDKTAVDKKAATTATPADSVAVDAVDAPDGDAAEIAAAIAKLPEDERAVATAQKVCPVGDAPLGSMGMPYKVTVKGRDVYLCCEGCKGSIERDPDKYLAKLDEAKAK